MDDSPYTPSPVDIVTRMKELLRTMLASLQRLYKTRGASDEKISSLREEVLISEHDLEKSRHRNQDEVIR